MKLLVVDDERAARSRLRRMLTAFSDAEVVGEAADGASALEQIRSCRPDAVFLDIQMPGLNGLDVAGALDEEGPLVVFITAYDEYAVEAFEQNALDYLVKPIDKDRLARTLERLRNRSLEGGSQKLTQLIEAMGRQRPCRQIAVRSGNRFLIFDLSKLSAVTAQDHYSEVIAQDQKALSEEPLDTLQSRLDPQRFLRIHRSAIINLEYLAQLRREGDRKFVAVLDDAFASEFPVSRNALPLLKSQLGL